MFTKTTVSAIRVLVFLGGNRTDGPVSPRMMAEVLGESPTYLAKVARLLSRAAIVRAQRGVAGGVLLNRPPETITLRAVVEACQGTVLGDFCHQTDDLAGACGFHRAGAELHDAIVGVLSRWTLADLLAKPCPAQGLPKHVRCWMEPCPSGSSQRLGESIGSIPQTAEHLE